MSNETHHRINHLSGAGRLLLGAFLHSYPEMDFTSLLGDQNLTSREEDISALLALLDDPRYGGCAATGLRPVGLSEIEFARCLYIDDDPKAWEQVLRAVFRGSVFLQTVAYKSENCIDEVRNAIEGRDLYTFVLLDLSLPAKGGQPSAENGLKLLRKISRWAPGSPVVVLTAHDDVLLWKRSLRAGADGYFYKSRKGGLEISAGVEYYLKYYTRFKALVREAIARSQPRHPYYVLSRLDLKRGLPAPLHKDCIACKLVSQVAEAGEETVAQIRLAQRYLRNPQILELRRNVNRDPASLILAMIFANLLEVIFIPLLKELNPRLDRKQTLGSAIKESQELIRKKDQSILTGTIKQALELWKVRNNVVYRGERISSVELLRMTSRLFGLRPGAKLHRVFEAAVAEGTPLESSVGKRNQYREKLKNRIVKVYRDECTMLTEGFRKALDIVVEIDKKVQKKEEYSARFAENNEYRILARHLAGSESELNELHARLKEASQNLDPSGEAFNATLKSLAGRFYKGSDRSEAKAAIDYSSVDGQGSAGGRG